MEKLLEETVAKIMVHDRCLDITAKCLSGTAANFKHVKKAMHNTNNALFALSVFTIYSTICCMKDIYKLRNEIDELKKTVEVEDDKE